MKQISSTAASLLIVLCSVLGATAPALAELGANRYSCQVITTTGKQGFLMIRTDSHEEALVMAARAGEAQTRSDTREAARQVVECVDFPSGQFADTQFQAFVDSLPR